MLQSRALEQVRVGQRRVGRFGLGPKTRTQQQHKDLAAHMRYCKLRKKTGSLRDLVKSHPDHHHAGRHFGKKVRLTPNRICQIAFGQCQKRTFLAERYDASKQTIRRALAFTALTVLEVQVKQLKDLRDFAVANPPDFSSASLSWDETSQILSLDTMNTDMAPVLRHQTASSWEVMVSKLQIDLHRLDHGVETLPRVCCSPFAFVVQQCLKFVQCSFQPSFHQGTHNFRC